MTKPYSFLCMQSSVDTEQDRTGAKESILCIDTWDVLQRDHRLPSPDGLSSIERAGDVICNEAEKGALLMRDRPEDALIFNLLTHTKRLDRVMVLLKPR